MDITSEAHEEELARQEEHFKKKVAEAHEQGFGDGKHEAAIQENARLWRFIERLWEKLPSPKQSEEDEEIASACEAIAQGWREICHASSNPTLYRLAQIRVVQWSEKADAWRQKARAQNQNNQATGNPKG